MKFVTEFSSCSPESLTRHRNRRPPSFPRKLSTAFIQDQDAGAIILRIRHSCGLQRPAILISYARARIHDQRERSYRGHSGTIHCVLGTRRIASAVTGEADGGDVSARRTPLYNLHVRLGGKLTEFAGFELPLQFATGVIAEHRQTRTLASLFDVSHMCRFVLPGNAGDTDQASAILESLTPMDVLGVPVGRARYGVFTNVRGGIVDDFIVGKLANELIVVSNASRRREVAGLLSKAFGEKAEPKRDQAMVALQGPDSEKALARILPGVANMKFLDIREFERNGSMLVVSRTGYTGEDGFEIILPGELADGLASGLLAMDEVELAGLGARDTLRLESGMCLYGNDLDETTSPVEARLAWTIGRARRAGGLRAGGYPGSDIIDAELAGGTKRTRVGLKAEGRVPLRRGTRIFSDPEGGEELGIVSSGGFGPSVGAPVSMAYLASGRVEEGRKVFGRVRKELLPARVAAMPFERSGN